MTTPVADPAAPFARLARGEIVSLTPAEWQALAGLCELLERHDTQLRGELLLVRTPAGLAAVEAPDAERRLLRPLGDQAAARAFIDERLRTYERMWDGCGCRIDYFS